MSARALALVANAANVERLFPFSLSSLPSNIAEALVSKGLATVIRYRQDDDQRSSHYDELLAAEAR